MLGLHDISAAFGTYISIRTQRVQIENVMADFNTITCGVAQNSVLGPLKVCCMYCVFWCIIRLHIIFILKTIKFIFHLNLNHH